MSDNRAREDRKNAQRLASRARDAQLDGHFQTAERYRDLAFLHRTRGNLHLGAKSR